MLLYVDGARLVYALGCQANDASLAYIARIADAFYIGDTKCRALFGEAVVFTDTRLCKDFRYNIKQNGGMLAKGRLLGIQFETLFTDGLYLRAAGHAIRQAAKIREIFAGKGYRFLSDSPTNQQFPILPNGLVARLHAEFGFEDWCAIDGEHTAVRFCTSWATTDEAIKELAAAIPQRA